eukprot:COSAG01_NODE_723_length_14060_cov_132.571807_2_plen_82_part_00
MWTACSLETSSHTPSVATIKNPSRSVSSVHSGLLLMYLLNAPSTNSPNSPAVARELASLHPPPSPHTRSGTSGISVSQARG